MNRLLNIRRLRIVLILGAVIMVLAVAGFFGNRLRYNSIHFVSTDNAQVAAALVQVGSLHAGRVIKMDADIGAPVAEGQVIATVDIPTVISRSETTDTPKLGFRDVRDQLVDVVAPTSGVVAARWVGVGDTVPAGQRVVTLMDTRQVWVVANINEKKLRRVRPGQYVDVQVDTLGRTLAGWVEAVSPVTAATFSLLPARNTSGNFTKVIQLVPVKIVLEDPRLPLVPGSSATVRIHVTR
jgi:multidrug resistance efflux pump